MPTHGREIPIQIRYAIITLKYHTDFSWSQIAAACQVDSHAANALYLRAKARATTEEFRDILTAAANMEGRGRKPVIVDGTPASAQFRAAFAEEYEITFEEVADLLFNVKLVRSTLENIARDHRDPPHDHALTRRVQMLKPDINVENTDLRLQFAE